MRTFSNVFEDLPHGAAIFAAVFLIFVAVWILLTGFHSTWKRTIHWGRNRTGPPVSTFGRLVASAMSLIVAATMLAGSFHALVLALALQITLGGVCIVLFIAIAFDYLKWKNGSANEHRGN